MPIKNYTTIVPVNRSISEIPDSLVKHRATGMLYTYEQGTGRIEALQFLLRIKNQDVAFSLPVHWRRFQRVLELQQVRLWDEEEYVYRVAWRNIRDWVMAQLALYETEIVEMPQVFLPFVTDAKGQTLYEHVQAKQRFLLGGTGGALNTKTQRLKENRSMKRTWIRWILLLLFVCIQTGCLCWSNCPQPEISAVERHTAHGYAE
jgi:hypothetical protein